MYQNPNYGNAWGPYYQTQPTWSNQSPTAVPNYVQQPSMIRGRVVKDQSEILPNEIPMDGTISFFPKSDGSEIYGKAWTSNGTIQNFRFVKAEEIQNGNAMNDRSISQQILDKLNKIESTLSNRQNFKQSNPNQKKEA